MVIIGWFVLGLLLSGVAIRGAMVLAHRFNVVDQPGGHKLHKNSTPFVGGVGIVSAFLCALFLLYSAQMLPPGHCGALTVGGVIVFLTGFADDVWRLSFKFRFAIQAIAILLMIFWAGVALDDLGQLSWHGQLELGWFAIPFTLFAAVGIINALNMTDGIDGLSGTVSLVSLFLLSLVAFSAGANAYVVLLAALMGGVVGFLYFNLRYPTQPHARVFLGDNGSMLLGFLFAWLLFDLSQGEPRAMPPVLGLWLFAVPLMDTVGVTLRRIWLGKSPFRPDRHHLHHLFIRAGFRIRDTVYTIALIQLGFGVAGFLAIQAGVSELSMFVAFLIAFMVYFYLIVRPWRCVPALRQIHARLGLSSPETQGVFLGGCSLEGATFLIDGLTQQMKTCDDFQLAVYKARREGRKDEYIYAVIELLTEDNEVSKEEARRLVNKLKNRFHGHMGIRIRQFLVRNHVNDRRVGRKKIQMDKRASDRRSKHSKILIHSAHGSSQPDAVIA